MPGMEMHTTAGQGSGWQVFPSDDGEVWLWTAYGPNGNMFGERLTEAGAREAAQIIERHLCQRRSVVRS